MQTRLVSLLAACLAATSVPGCVSPEGQAPESAAPFPMGSDVLANDTFFSRQWSLQLSRVPEAWAYATGKNVTIAFLDSGIDLNHPDLAEKLVLVEGAAMASGSLQDQMGHGTGVAGIAAASRNNGMGIVGVAPGARIMPIQLMKGVPANGIDELLEPGFTQRFADAIHLAVDNGAGVISMSFVSDPPLTMDVTRPEVTAAFEYAWSKGTVLVAAAGNNAVAPFCEGASSHPRVLCVASVGPTGATTYSTRDVRGDFVAAPGGGDAGSPDCMAQILTTTPKGLGYGSCTKEDRGADYSSNSGASYAAPFVAGLAALLLEQGLTNQEVVQRIKDTADPVPLFGSPEAGAPVYGHGIVNALCAVTADQGPACT